MRYLGRELARTGMTVIGPTLPGHNATPEALAQVSWRDWYEAVDEAVATLQRECDQVALVGQSLGGLLALKMAQDQGAALTAIASLAAPLWLTPMGRAAARITGWFPRIWRLPKTGIDISDKTMAKRIPSYSTIPMAPLRSLVELANDVRTHLHEIESPILILHSKNDHTAPYACSKVIAAEVRSEYIRHRSFERSHHLLSLDCERTIVAAEVTAFLEHHFNRGEDDEIRRID